MPRMNQRIGRYVLMKEIGRGGMADVWLGRASGPSGFEKIVAIKLLNIKRQGGAEYMEALADEARVQVALKHPNIVEIYDLNFDSDTPFIVMEYVDGIDLRELLDGLRSTGKTLPLPLAAYIISQISLALSYAHERRDPRSGEPLKIVHRDISPSNILISCDGDIKLTDFGIAKSILQTNETQVGLLKGKVHYMSPEHANGEPVDCRSDIFSMGLLFFECLYGPAYSDREDIVVYQKARNGQVTYPPEIDPKLEIILKKLLKKDPAERYANLNDFRRDLGQFALDQEGMGDRSTLKRLLDRLNLKSLQEARSLREQALSWTNAAIEIEDDEKTGELPLPSPDGFFSFLNRRVLTWGISIITGLGLIGIVLVNRGPSASNTIPSPAQPETQKLSSVTAVSPGSLTVESDQADISVTIRFAKSTMTKIAPATFSDLPLGETIEVTASRKGHENQVKKVVLSNDSPQQTLKFSLTEVRQGNVIFEASPFALVSIRGQFSNMETPFRKSLPPGTYSVSFNHPPTGHSTQARLEVRAGGSVVCDANMAVEGSDAASAFCKLK